MSGLNSGRMPHISLGSMGGGGGGLPSPYLIDVAMSPGGGLMTLPLPDSLPHSTPDMLMAALQHAGLGGLMAKGGSQVSLKAATCTLPHACYMRCSTLVYPHALAYLLMQ